MLCKTVEGTLLEIQGKLETFMRFLEIIRIIKMLSFLVIKINSRYLKHIYFLNFFSILN